MEKMKLMLFKSNIGSSIWFLFVTAWSCVTRMEHFILKLRLLGKKMFPQIAYLGKTFNAILKNLLTTKNKTMKKIDD